MYMVIFEIALNIFSVLVISYWWLKIPSYAEWLFIFVKDARAAVSSNRDIILHLPKATKNIPSYMSFILGINFDFG